MVPVEAGQRVALVTGAEGLVGSAIVERLRSEGFLVAGLDVDGGGGDLSLAVDLGDPGQVARAVERTIAELGPISVLATAQARHVAAPFGDMPAEQWRELLSFYLRGTVNVCAAVVPGMVASGRGTVIICSSWLALAGVPGEAYMAAATGTLLAFSKSFSLEVAPKGVRVNCVTVGPLDGEETASPQWNGVLPSLRVRPSQVADTVSFLVRDGDFFVGQVLRAVSGAVI
jgi:2-hydroxycyclohexanecarboxyl-CoA dehydrogenase